MCFLGVCAYLLLRESKGVKTKEWAKVKCPICRSDFCVKEEVEPSLVEFICVECKVFKIHEEILTEHLHRSISKRQREIVSATLRHYFESTGNPIKIVLWHSKKAINGVSEKTISELKKEGKVLFKGLAQ
jgi:hypothetical protein